MTSLAFGFDVSVDADNDGFAVDAGFGFFVAVAAGDRESLAGGGLRSTDAKGESFRIRRSVMCNGGDIGTCCASGGERL